MRIKDDPSQNYSSLPKNRSDPSSFQPPPGYEIGGDAVPDHHKGSVRPIATSGEGEPSEFQPPTGQILGDDLPMGNSLEGMTDNVLGSYAKRGDLDDRGVISMADNPSVESINATLVNTEEPPLPPGFLRRANGWER